MAQAVDYEQKAREAEELAASCRHQALREAFEKMARDFRALAQCARDASANAEPKLQIVEQSAK